MQDSKIKEDLSISYITAVSANAGIAFDIQRHDDDSTDGILKKKIQLENGGNYLAMLRVQLKATSSKSQYKEYEDEITYRLKVKNYNELCEKGSSLIILALLILPEDEEKWVKWSAKELLMKGTMYWKIFLNKNLSENSGTVTVRFDKKNVINSDTLNNILIKTAKKELS